MTGLHFKWPFGSEMSFGEYHASVFWATAFLGSLEKILSYHLHMPLSLSLSLSLSLPPPPPFVRPKSRPVFAHLNWSRICLITLFPALCTRVFDLSTVLTHPPSVPVSLDVLQPSIASSLSSSLLSTLGLHSQPPVPTPIVGPYWPPHWLPALPAPALIRLRRSLGLGQTLLATARSVLGCMAGLVGWLVGWFLDFYVPWTAEGHSPKERIIYSKFLWRTSWKRKSPNHGQKVPDVT